MDDIRNSKEWVCPYPFITTDFLTKKEREYIAQSLTDKPTDIYSEFDKLNVINNTEEEKVEENVTQKSAYDDLFNDEQDEDESDELEYGGLGYFDQSELDYDASFGFYDNMTAEQEEDPDNDEDLFDSVSTADEDLFDSVSTADEDLFESLTDNEESYGTEEIDMDEDDDIVDMDDVLSIIGTPKGNTQEEKEQVQDTNGIEVEEDSELTLDKIFENFMYVNVVYGKEILGKIKLELKYLKILNSFFTREWNLQISETENEIINADFMKLNMLRL